MTDSASQYVLAIDLGTGGPKVAIVSETGRILAHATEETPVQFLPGGAAEQDPHAWWNAIVRAARAVIATSAVPPTSIIAISCSTQWSVTVPVDRDGEPLMNAVSWMDTRGAKYCRAITDGLIKVQGYDIFKLYRWIRLTGGCPTHSGADSLAHMLFIKHERPDIYARTHKFLEPMDYINFRLTGKFAATASTVLAMWLTDNRDLEKPVYDNGLLKLTGIDRDKLPELLPQNAILGTLTSAAARELGLDETVQVVSGTGDNHAATVGSGAVNDFEGHCYIGTTSWLCCHVPFKKTDIAHLITTLPAALPGRYIVLAQQGTGGECFKFFKENILLPSDPLNLRVQGDPFYLMNETAATAPPGSNKVIFAPFLTGVMTPLDDRHARGSFINLSLKTTRADMIRAIMEGVAYNLCWLLPHVEKLIGRRMDTLNFIGGGAQSDLWSQILADVLDRRIRQMAEPRQANVRGGALVALHALGLVRKDDMNRFAPVARTYEPDRSNAPVYNELFREFLMHYKKTKGIYRRLNADR